LSDGSASGDLISRIQTVVDLYNKEHIKNNGKIFILVTGGKVQLGDNIPTEACVMKNILLSHNIEESIIILEEYAKTTIENVRFSFEIVEELGITRILLVTADYHMQRSRQIFERIFSTDYDISYHESHSILSEATMNKEQQVEKRMLLQLDNDLKK